MGLDQNGYPVYAGRGFSYVVKNWELEEKKMTNEEKLALLNTIEVVESSACAGELEYVYVDQNMENRTKLMILGVTEAEMDSHLDDDNECIDVVPFISNYVEYRWFQESLGGFLEYLPMERDETNNHQPERK